MTSDLMGGDDGDADDATGGDGDDGDDAGGDDGGDEDEDDIEIVGMADHVSYLAPVLRTLAILHTCTAIAMMIGYYVLKVNNSIHLPLYKLSFNHTIFHSLELALGDVIW